ASVTWSPLRPSVGDGSSTPSKPVFGGPEPGDMSMYGPVMTVPRPRTVSMPTSGRTIQKIDPSRAMSGPASHALGDQPRRQLRHALREPARVARHAVHSSSVPEGLSADNGRGVSPDGLRAIAPAESREFHLGLIALSRSGSTVTRASGIRSITSSI